MSPFHDRDAAEASLKEARRRLRLAEWDSPLADHSAEQLAVWVAMDAVGAAQNELAQFERRLGE